MTRVVSKETILWDLVGTALDILQRKLFGLGRGL